MTMNGETYDTAGHSIRPEARQSPGGYEAVLEAVLGAWKRRKWLAIPLFAAMCTAVVSVVEFLPDVYRSTATVLVERQKVPEAFVRSTITSGIDDRLRVITQQSLSRSRLESLISRFDLYADMRQREPMERVLRHMRQNITLRQKRTFQGRRRERTTAAFDISYHGRDPQAVARVTNALASFYIGENLKVREQQATGTSKFLEVQLENMRRKLEEQEQRLSQYKERYIGQLPEQLGANLARLESLNMQLRLNGEKQARAGVQRTELTQQLAELRERRRSGEAPVGATDDTRLEGLLQELAALRTRFNDNYPDVVQLRLKIAALAQPPAGTGSGTEPDKPVEPPMGSYARQLRENSHALDTELQTLQALERNLLRTIALYQERVEDTPRREQELKILLRDYDTTKGLYRSLLQRKQEAQLSESLEQRQQGERFHLLEAATPSVLPAEPNRRKLTLMGIMLSLSLVVGVVFVVEFLDTSFHTVEDLRTFSRAPVLVHLSHIVTAADVRRRRWRFGLAAVSTVMGLVLIVGVSYVTIKGPAELVELWAHVQHLRQ